MTEDQEDIQQAHDLMCVDTDAVIETFKKAWDACPVFWPDDPSITLDVFDIQKPKYDGDWYRITARTITYSTTYSNETDENGQKLKIINSVREQEVVLFPAHIIDKPARAALFADAWWHIAVQISTIASRQPVFPDSVDYAMPCDWFPPSLWKLVKLDTSEDMYKALTSRMCKLLPKELRPELYSVLGLPVPRAV